MTVAAILLAAGESRRMGRPKALLDWDGRPLLAYQLAELERSRVERVVVVLGHRARELLPLCQEPKVQVALNPHYRQGATTSLKAGVAALPPAMPKEAGALLILRVDQPRPQPLLDALLEAHLGHPHLISIPVYQGRRGHPPIFAAALIPELAAVREEGRGLREVLARHAGDVRQVPIADPIVLLDLNRLEDYQRARALYAARPRSPSI